MDAGAALRRCSPALPCVLHHRRSCLFRRSLLPRAESLPPLPASRISPLFPQKSFLLPPAASPARAHSVPPSVDGRSVAGPWLGGRLRCLPPPPSPGAAAPAPVAWGAAVMARRETVAKESSAQAVSRIVSSCANSTGLAPVHPSSTPTPSSRLPPPRAGWSRCQRCSRRCATPQRSGGSRSCPPPSRPSSKRVGPARTVCTRKKASSNIVW
uniref:Uncharacterized protein n=1 Tax=Triticum urartu TaxID=4572 RepID=A0A8R7QDX9_TRIUA